VRCPSCQNALSARAEAGVGAWVCAGGCGGLWFPLSAVRQLTERPPADGSGFLAVERADGVRLFRNPEHPCPHCRTTLLYRHGFSRRLELEIDQCSKCGGYFVDPGILARAGDMKIAAETRQALARDYFAELFENRVRQMNLVNHDTLESARQIVRIFQFITPPDCQTPPPLELA